MKKLLTTSTLKQTCLEKSGFLNRADIAVFTADTNDDILKIHIAEKVDLIVTELTLPGIRSEELFSIIEQSRELREVLTILVCENTVGHRERCRRCGVHAIFTILVDSDLLVLKILEFLNVAPRRAYRVALTVAVEGKFNNRPFLYRTENISATGMLIRADDLFAVGDRISFSFYLPDGTRVSGEGEIVRVAGEEAGQTDCLYGIKFTDVDPHARLVLEAFIQKQLNYESAYEPHEKVGQNS